MRYVKLEEICFKGVSSLRQKDTLPVGDYPVYGASGICGYLSGYQHNEPYVAVVKDGAGVGRVQLCSGKSSVLGTLQALLPKDEVSCEYLYEVVRSLELGAGFTGSTIPHIYFKDYKNRTVVIYEKEQQTKITTLFTTLKNVVELHKCAISFYDELVKSRFIEMFGDPEAPDFPYMMVELGDVLRKPASNGFFAKRKDYVEDGNVEILGVANVVNRMYSGIDNLPKTNGTSADIEKYSLSYGDMLFCRSSLVLEGIGKASIVPREVRPNTLFECHVIRMPLDISVCVPEFMQLQSTLPAFRKQVMTKAKTATMTTIDQKSLLSIKVFLPPIEEQKYFLSFIEQVDKLKFETQQSIEKLQMLYDSLAQEYFAPEGD